MNTQHNHGWLPI